MRTVPACRHGPSAPPAEGPVPEREAEAQSHPQQEGGIEAESGSYPDTHVWGQLQTHLGPILSPFLTLILATMLATCSTITLIQFFHHVCILWVTNPALLRGCRKL